MEKGYSQWGSKGLNRVFCGQKEFFIGDGIKLNLEGLVSVKVQMRLRKMIFFGKYKYFKIVRIQSLKESG